MPCGGFCSHQVDVWQTSAFQTLARERTQFIFGDVQPTGVFGRVAEFQTAVRHEGLVEGAFRVVDDIFRYKSSNSSDRTPAGLTSFRARGGLSNDH